MLSFLRAASPQRRSTAHLSTVTYEDGTSKQTFYPKASHYFTSHLIPNENSFMNPPLHLHLFQDEEFHVSQGVGIWRQPTAPDQSSREVVKRAGETMFLPKGKYHQFCNASSTEPLEVKIRVNPPGTNSVKEEMFFRNFFGYLDDCRAHSSAPSIFQMELFLYSVDGPLAIPVPGPDLVKWWVSRAVMYFLGVVIGENLLGYQRSYPEYYSGVDTGD